MKKTAPPPRQKGGLPAGVLLPEYPPEADTVFHFSEDPDIRVFVPRPVASNPESEPLVWAIDDAHSWLYLFPRECPRAAFWELPTTTPDDRERFLTHAGGTNVVAIESGWLERIRATTVYQYTFSSEGFVSLRDHGVHVSRATVTPVSVEPIADLLGALAARDVEVRISPSLWPLWDGIVHSSLHFSGIRMRNAQPRPAVAE